MYNAQHFDEVNTDIERAKIWYREQKEGLEIKFASAIQTTMKSILLMPYAHTVRFNKIRIAHLVTFPYNIHYYIEDETKTVVFTAIVHNKRNQQQAFNRLQ